MFVPTLLKAFSNCTSRISKCPFYTMFHADWRRQDVSVPERTDYDTLTSAGDYSLWTPPHSSPIFKANLLYSPCDSDNVAVGRPLPKTLPSQQAVHLRTNVRDYGQPLKQEEVKDTHEEDNEFTKETIALVNNQVTQGQEGRLFAVIHVAGKQCIVTQEDIIIIHGQWPPTASDQIKFEKVMLVGGSDFTLIGRPVLPPELVSVKATVIDKDLSHVKTKFRFRKRKQFRRINFIRSPLTMVRINEVKIVGKVNERNDVEGLNKVIY